MRKRNFQRACGKNEVKMGGAQWVYDIVIHLPFGWKVIRLSPSVKKFVGEQHNSPLLYKKIEGPPGTFREIYWPKGPAKK